MVVLDQFGFINNLFYPTGEARETTAAPISPAVTEIKEQVKEASPLKYQLYTLSSKWRKILLLPLAVWYLLWQLSPMIPLHLRPNINVDVLYESDKYLFATLPHRDITFMHSEHMDVLMAIPYTLHVAWPLIFVGWALRKSSKLILPFGNAFGLLSFMAVVTELLFPCAPPWYYEKYGPVPASYDLKGDPGGLSRLDQRFNITFYDDTFSKSPLVFGAFPSLHVAWPVLLALFMWHNVCSKWSHKVPVMAYVAWVCVSVVYLHHHYVVDVIGGITYAWLAYKLVGPHCDERSVEHKPKQVTQEYIAPPPTGSASQ